MTFAPPITVVMQMLKIIMVMMIDDVGIEEDGDEDRKTEYIKIIVLRCYPAPSYDVEVDVHDDDGDDNDDDVDDDGGGDYDDGDDDDDDDDDGE